MSNDEPEKEEDVAQPVFPSKGPNREEMTSDYLPESDDWFNCPVCGEDTVFPDTDVTRECTECEWSVTIPHPNHD